MKSDNKCAKDYFKDLMAQYSHMVKQGLEKPLQFLVNNFNKTMD